MNITEIIDDTNENNNDDFMTIEISPLYLLIAIIPCLLSIICCLSFSLYRFIKVLINKK